MPKAKKRSTEISLIGEVDDWEDDVIKALLDVPAGGECVFYFDTMGGSVYGALAVTTLIRQRQLRCTGVVLGECSSASLLSCRHFPSITGIAPRQRSCGAGLIHATIPCWTPSAASM